MRIDGKTEVQHYVPQVLLRFHVNDASAKRGSEQVWCFDKKTDRVFTVTIRGVMSGTRFYEVEIDCETFSLEEPLSEIKGQVRQILTILNLAERGGLKPQLSRKARFTREIAAISFSTANFKIARVKCCQVP
jgi:hypothetical protein